MTETTTTATSAAGRRHLMDGARLRDDTERLAAEMLALGSPRGLPGHGPGG
jgi:hypothetical protein